MAFSQKLLWGDADNDVVAAENFNVDGGVFSMVQVRSMVENLMAVSVNIRKGQLGMVGVLT